MKADTQSLDKIRTIKDLVARSQEGEMTAFGELFEQFQPLVMSILLRRLRNYGDAQELSQDIFIKAMTKIHQLEVPEAFVGWLKSITIRMSINFLQRKRIASAGDLAAIEWVESAEQSPFETAVDAEKRLEVRRGLEQLRDLDRETLEAFYVRGCSILEMSDEFAAPVGTIKRRLHVARHRLEAEIGVEAVA